ncbi:MAG: hypothetical protein PHE78_05720 [Candidatus Gastranaerophilales bacterium]|nr:hypothetical protein [Candidatus Gastranaerophilales bacterium]
MKIMNYFAKTGFNKVSHMQNAPLVAGSMVVGKSGVEVYDTLLVAVNNGVKKNKALQEFALSQSTPRVLAQNVVSSYDTLAYVIDKKVSSLYGRKQLLQMVEVNKKAYSEVSSASLKKHTEALSESSDYLLSSGSNYNVKQNKQLNSAIDATKQEFFNDLADAVLTRQFISSVTNHFSEKPLNKLLNFFETPFRK